MFETRKVKEHKWDYTKTKAKKSKREEWWKTSYSDFGGDVGKIYDYRVGDYVKEHMTFFDRFNMRKVAAATLYAHSILSKCVEAPDGNWKFYKDF